MGAESASSFELTVTGVEEEYETSRQFMYTRDPRCEKCGKILTTNITYKDSNGKLHTVSSGVCSECKIDKAINTILTTPIREDGGICVDCIQLIGEYYKFRNSYKYWHYKYIDGKWLTFDDYWLRYQGTEYWNELKQKHYGEKYWKGIISWCGKYSTILKLLLSKYEGDIHIKHRKFDGNWNLVSGITYNKAYVSKDGEIHYDNIELTDVRFPTLNRVPCFRIDSTKPTIDGCFTIRSAPYYKSEIELVRDWKQTKKITRPLTPHKWTPLFTDESEAEWLANLRKDMAYESLGDEQNPLLRTANAEDAIRAKDPVLYLYFYSRENLHPAYQHVDKNRPTNIREFVRYNNQPTTKNPPTTLYPFAVRRRELVSWKPMWTPDEIKKQDMTEQTKKFKPKPPLMANIKGGPEAYKKLLDEGLQPGSIIKGMTIKQGRDSKSAKKLRDLHDQRYTSPPQTLTPEFDENELHRILVEWDFDKFDNEQGTTPEDGEMPTPQKEVDTLVELDIDGEEDRTERAAKISDNRAVKDIDNLAMKFKKRRKPTRKQHQRREKVLQLDRICKYLKCTFNQLENNTVLDSYDGEMLQDKACKLYESVFGEHVDRHGLRDKFKTYKRYIRERASS